MISAVPISLRDANAFVAAHHRHHKASRGHKFSIGAKVKDDLVGVVIVGRPVSRMLDDGFTAEIVRLCTNGARNACSFLYARAVRAALAMGYKRVVTYTLAEEGGASLRAASFVQIRETCGGSWSREKRPRTDKAPITPKRLWMIEWATAPERAL